MGSQRNFVIGTLLLLSAWPSARAQSVTPTPETGVTPSTLVVCRADLVPGKGVAYAQTQADIVREYVTARIPVYWLALQSVTNSPHVLYFDGYDSFAAVEQAGADIAQGLKTHPELAALQQKLEEYVSAPRTMLAFRRDDLGYRLNKIDLAKARFVRVSILQFRPGYEEKFADAVRARARIYETNDIDTPWMIYQVHSGLPLPTFIEFQPMNSFSEIDDALDRNKKSRRVPGEARQLATQKWMREAELSVEIEIYSVNLAMSRLAGQKVAAAATPERPAFAQNGEAVAWSEASAAAPSWSFVRTPLQPVAVAMADDESRHE
jgi:hypothetical protein